jgi:hypothetical protein
MRTTVKNNIQEKENSASNSQPKTKNKKKKDAK